MLEPSLSLFQCDPKRWARAFKPEPMLVPPLAITAPGFNYFLLFEFNLFQGFFLLFSFINELGWL